MRSAFFFVCFVTFVVFAAGCEPEPCSVGRQTFDPGEELIVDCHNCVCVDGDEVDCDVAVIPDCGGSEGEGEEGEGEEGEGEEGEGEEGEGEEGEGEGEEGEGEEGEGEGEGEFPACVVDSVAGVAGAIPQPQVLIVVRGITPVVTSAAGGSIVTIDLEDGFGFVPDVVGDYVVGADADACLVRVLPPPTGLFLEALWTSPASADLDLNLARIDANGACAGEAFAFPGVDVRTCAAGTEGFCSFANCNEADVGRGAFDGVNALSDSDALLLRDSTDAGSEGIIVKDPAVGRYLASVFVFSTTEDVDVTLRAWLDGALMAEQQVRLAQRTSGAGLLIDIGADRSCIGDAERDACDDDDVCADDDDCGAGLVCGGGACAGDADLCGEGCVGCADDACAPTLCADPDDVGDTVTGAPVIGDGTHVNVLCPGDVDVFVLDVVVGDTVFVAGPGQATLAGPGGPLVDGLVTALPVTLTWVQPTIDPFGGDSFTVTVVGVDRLCDDEEAFEPNDDAASANDFRRSGRFCADTDVDCVSIGAFSVIDIVKGACVVDGDACVPADTAFAGPDQPLCLGTAGAFPVAWTLGTPRAVDCSAVVDEAVGFDAVDGANGVFCGVDREFGDLTVPAQQHVTVNVESAAAITGFPLLFLPRRAPRSEAFLLDGVPPVLSDGTTTWTLRVDAVDVECADNGIVVDEGVCVGVVGDGCDAPVDISAVDLDACDDADAAGCLDGCADDRFFRLGVLDGGFQLTVGAADVRRFSLVRSRGDGTFTTLQQLDAPSVTVVDGDGGYAVRVRNPNGAGATPWSLQLDAIP